MNTIPTLSKQVNVAAWIQHGSYLEFTSKFKKFVIDNPADKYIFFSEGEAPYYQIVRKILADPRVAVVDSGAYSCHERHIVSPTFLEGLPQDQYIPVSFDNRRWHYLNLNRGSRNYRIGLINLIYSSGIEKYGINTMLGYIPDHYSTKTVKPLLPIESDVNFDITFMNQVFHPQFKECFINVVAESSSYPSPDPIFNCWDRVFLTEKTLKPFLVHQLPLFNATSGHVQYIRELGFDVFDDFIDHSYDKAVDPVVKLTLVFAELQRLCKMPITEIRDFCNKNESRFVKNKLHVNEKYHIELNRRNQELIRFLEN